MSHPGAVTRLTGQFVPQAGALALRTWRSRVSGDPNASAGARRFGSGQNRPGMAGPHYRGDHPAKMPAHVAGAGGNAFTLCTLTNAGNLPRGAARIQPERDSIVRLVRRASLIHEQKRMSMNGDGFRGLGHGPSWVWPVAAPDYRTDVLIYQEG